MKSELKKFPSEGVSGEEWKPELKKFPPFENQNDHPFETIIEFVEGFSIITYQNKKIVRADYTTIATDKEKILNLIEKVKSECMTYAPHSALVLTKLVNLHIDMDTLNKFKATVNEIQNHLKKEAFINIHEILSQIFNGPHSKGFATEQEALDWLVI